MSLQSSCWWEYIINVGVAQMEYEMNIEALKEQLPEYAKDIRLNISHLFGNLAHSQLTEQQFYGTALAVAYCLQQVELITAIKEEAKKLLTPELDAAIRTAAALMAMNNVYYRFLHLVEDKDFSTMPANLRMNGLRSHGVPQIDFELFALAVSALSGCGLCIRSHVQQLISHGMSKVAIQSSIRLAATLNAVAQILSQKEQK